MGIHLYEHVFLLYILCRDGMYSWSGNLPQSVLPIYAYSGKEFGMNASIRLMTYLVSKIYIKIEDTNYLRIKCNAMVNEWE